MFIVVVFVRMMAHCPVCYSFHMHFRLSASLPVWSYSATCLTLHTSRQPVRPTFLWQRVVDLDFGSSVVKIKAQVLIVSKSTPGTAFSIQMFSRVTPTSNVSLRHTFSSTKLYYRTHGSEDIELPETAFKLYKPSASSAYTFACSGFSLGADTLNMIRQFAYLFIRIVALFRIYYVLLTTRFNQIHRIWRITTGNFL